MLPSKSQNGTRPKTRRIRIDDLDRAQLSAELAEIRLGWSRAVPRTRSVAQPGASHCARQFVLTVLAHALMTLF